MISYGFSCSDTVCVENTLKLHCPGFIGDSVNAVIFPYVSCSSIQEIFYCLFRAMMADEQALSTPNFGPSLTKLVGTIRVTKKMTQNDNGSGTALFVKGAFVSFWHLRIYCATFCFRVTPVFVRGTRPTRQKVFPHPTVGAPSASNSPSALSAQALRAMENR